VKNKLLKFLGKNQTPPPPAVKVEIKGANDPKKIMGAADTLFKFFQENGFTISEYTATINLVGQRIQQSSKVGGQ
jgi:hypothetical protein